VPSTGAPENAGERQRRKKTKKSKFSVSCTRCLVRQKMLVTEGEEKKEEKEE